MKLRPSFVVLLLGLALLPGGLVAVSMAQSGRILRVGPNRQYRTPSEASYVVQNGDTIVIDGGDSLVMGNVLYQGENALNSTIVSYGAEGLTNQTNDLAFINNTIVSDRSSPVAVFVDYRADHALLANNIFVGVTTISDGVGTQLGNLKTAEIEQAGLQASTLTLLADSPAIDAGVDLSSVDTGLIPTHAYRQPMKLGRRIGVGTIDQGAYEFSLRAIMSRP